MKLLRLPLTIIVAAVGLGFMNQTGNPSATALDLRQNPKGCANTLLPSTPSEVVCVFYALAEAGNIDEAMTYQTDLVLPAGNEDLKRGTRVISAKPFANPARAKQVYEGLDRLVKIEDEIHDQYRAEVVAQTTMPGGAGTRLTHINLYKIDGQWKIALSIAADNKICEEDPRICYIVDRDAAKRLAPEN